MRAGFLVRAGTAGGVGSSAAHGGGSPGCGSGYSLHLGASQYASNCNCVWDPNNPAYQLDGFGISANIAAQINVAVEFNFWLNLDTLTGTDAIILGLGGPTSSWMYGCYVRGTDHKLIGFWRSAAGVVTNTDPNVTIVAGTWYNVGFTVYRQQGALNSFFAVLAVNAGTQTTNGGLGVWPTQGADTNFVLGTNPTLSPLGQQSMRGRIDSLGVWGRQLTNAERTTLYAGGAGLDYCGLTGSLLTGLNAWYDFDTIFQDVFHTNYAIDATRRVDPFNVFSENLTLTGGPVLAPPRGQ